VPSGNLGVNLTSERYGVDLKEQQQTPLGEK